MKRSFLLAIALIAVLAISSLAVTVVMTAGAVGLEYQTLQEQIKVFESQNPGIDVVLMPMPNSSTDRYNLYVTYLSSQMPQPDVYMLDTIWPPAFADFLAPLNSFFSADDMKDFFPGAVNAGTYDSKMVAIPWFIDAGLLYYRKDLLEKYGFQPPQTWDELVHQAEVISKGENIDGFVWQGASYEGLTCDLMEWVHSYGGAILNEQGKVVSDTPQVKTTLQMAYDMVYKSKITPKGVTTWMEEDSRHVFQNGDAVFMRNWPYCWPLLNSNDSAVNGKVGVEPLPEGSGFPNVRHSATLGGWQLGISKYSEHFDAALKLVKFLVSPDQEAYKAIHAGQNPSRLSVYNNPAVIQANPFYKSLWPVFQGAEPRPKSPIYPQISEILFTNVNKMLSGQLSVDQTQKNITDQLKQLLNQ